MEAVSASSASGHATTGATAPAAWPWPSSCPTAPTKATSAASVRCDRALGSRGSAANRHARVQRAPRANFCSLAARSTDAQFRDWTTRHRHECSFGLSPQGAAATSFSAAPAAPSRRAFCWSSSSPLARPRLPLRRSHDWPVADQAHASQLAPAALRHEAQLALNDQQPRRALALAMLSLHKSAPSGAASLDPSALELQGGPPCWGRRRARPVVVRNGA